MTTAPDTCQVGDPDPTPDIAPLHGMCGAEDQDWTCTRYAGHAGSQHVAGCLGVVRHVWPWAPGWHRGRARISARSDGGVTVLCPLGHLVTAAAPGHWAGSDLAARIGFGWDVECTGATSPPPTPVSITREENPMSTGIRWSDFSDAQRAELTTYLETDPRGKAVADYAGDDPEFRLWLLRVDAACGKRLQLSMFDLADFCWRDEYDADAAPREALSAAIAAEGLG